jgi:hypothetical protein
MQSLRARWPVTGRSSSSSIRNTTSSTAAAPLTSLLHHQPRAARPSAALRASADENAAAANAATTTTSPSPPCPPQALSTSDFDEGATPPPGCSRYTVNIKKPFGLVFEQDKASLVITVAELTPEGAAERAGVGLGDQLIATSGVVYGAVEEYGEVQVKKQQQRIRLSARGETLKTIGAAVASHPGNWEVTLELQRCGMVGGGGATV